MALIILVYIIHTISFSFLEINTTIFKYAIGQLYLFFGTFSIVILVTLIKVKQKNIDIVGNVFLLLTTIKMIVSYILARPILNLTANNTIQKWQFFILFLLFLIAETVFTIYLLNSKNTKKED